MKEITGSGIFAANGENDESESGSANPPNKTGLRMYQVLLVMFLHYSKNDYANSFSSIYDSFALDSCFCYIFILIAYC